jgi:hypothetical protein
MLSSSNDSAYLSNENMVSKPSLNLEDFNLLQTLGMNIAYT